MTKTPGNQRADRNTLVHEVERQDTQRTGSAADQLWSGNYLTAAAEELNTIARRFEGMADAAQCAALAEANETISLEAKAGSILFGFVVRGYAEPELRLAVDAAAASIPGFAPPHPIFFAAIFDCASEFARRRLPDLLQFPLPALPKPRSTETRELTSLRRVQHRVMLSHAAGVCRFWSRGIEAASKAAWSTPEPMKEISQRFGGLEKRTLVERVLSGAQLHRVKGTKLWTYRSDLAPAPSPK